MAGHLWTLSESPSFCPLPSSPVTVMFLLPWPAEEPQANVFPSNSVPFATQRDFMKFRISESFRISAGRVLRVIIIYNYNESKSRKHHPWHGESSWLIIAVVCLLYHVVATATMLPNPSMEQMVKRQE